jgi:hypothetical protein
MKRKVSITIFRLFILGILSTPLLFVACKKDKDVAVVTVNMGNVQGKIVAENGTRHLPAVKVFVDINGEVYLTHTDTKGEFKLNVPEGEHLLYIHAGDGNLFFSTEEITVKKGETTTAGDGGVMKLRQVANLAYISGSFDNIQSIIIDTLGYSADELTVQDLLDPSLLSNFQAIFLNCGAPESMEGAMYQNLENYLSNGGSLYASDWAVSYLTGDGNIKSMAHKHDHEHPDHMSHAKNCTSSLGGFLTDDMLCTQKQGSQTTISGASVVHQDIQNVVGGMTMNVYYNLGGWDVIRNLGPEFDVLIQDNQNYGPLAVRSNGLAPWASGATSGGSGYDGSGNWVTICHIPPGNPNNPQTITISVNALQAHLDHGCYVGSCGGSGGSLIYTTFHNYPQGTVSQDTYDILQYFITNL